MNLPSNLFDGDINAQVILCQPNKARIGEILVYDLNGTFKFNSYSEISFSIDRYYNDMIGGTTRVNPYYDLIEGLRVIELRGIGHFVIQDVESNYAENDSKSVTCFSLEYSTGQKYLENFYVNTGEEGSVETMYHAQQYGAEYSIDNYYEVVDISKSKFDPFQRYYKKEYSNNTSYNYVEEQVLDEANFSKYTGENSETTLYVTKYPNVRFYWPTVPGLSLLHLIFSLIPEWKIGHVDKELWYQERTFREDRTAIYDFLHNTAADTLSFVIEWDSIRGVANFYKTEEDGIVKNNDYQLATVFVDGITYYKKVNDIYIAPDEQPKNTEEVINGMYYISGDQYFYQIETQWDTDIFISRENLSSEIDVQYSTDDIKTKLKITGSDSLDIRDVNLGQNYILNLEFYNTDLWMGADLSEKYTEYTKLLKEKTVEYKHLISEWSAAYNEYSDLMNEIPVEPRVLLIGDPFDKLYCTYGTILEDEIDTSVNLLKKQLWLYNVGLDDNGEIATIDLSDDVLLTLENEGSDSVTIRVKCKKIETNYKESEYKVSRTVVTASTGAINTREYTLTEWIQGKLDMESLNLNQGFSSSDFKIKSIGTLGAYLCLARDEASAEDIEDYGIRLLEEKRDTYTKIFITQTEGYMSKEGSQCIAQDDEPQGSNITAGTKWLDTNAESAPIYIYYNERWNKYEADNNLADFKNYTRFIDNYKKLQVVQEVLKEKQYEANLLLNGIANREVYLSNNTINLDNLLRVASMHSVISNRPYIVSESQPATEYNIEGAIWFEIKTDPNTGNSEYVRTWQYTSGKWTENASDIKIELTGYNVNNDYGFGYISYILNPQYVDVSTFSEDDIYRINVGTTERPIYQAFYAQPKDQIELDGMYVCNIPEDATYILDGAHVCKLPNEVRIGRGTSCVFTINGVMYEFIAPKELNKDTKIIYNSNRLSIDDSFVSCNISDNGVTSMVRPLDFHKNKIGYFIIGDNTYKFTFSQEINKNSKIRFDSKKLVINGLFVDFEITEEEITEDMQLLNFEKVTFFVVRGSEYAAYVVDGVPYVSYARSQGLCLAKMNVIKKQTDMNTYFSPEELVRLSPFIREDEYNDVNFLLTSYESEEEQMNIKQSLLDKGIEELNQICRPKLSFDMTMANILSIPEFEPLKWQFKLGNFVTIGIRDDWVERARLLEVHINFEDASDFQCTFGNLVSTKSEIDKHADLLRQAVTAGKSVASNASKWQRGADTSTKLDQAINDGLKNAALSVGAANGQAITWDQYGIRGRKLIEGTTDQYHDEQFALINNKLAFTTDNWKTSKAVVGEFDIEINNVKQRMYGLIADALVGGYIQGAEIRGGKLEIGGNQDGDKKFIVKEDGTVEIGIVRVNGEERTIESAYASTNALDQIDQAYRYRVVLSSSGPTVFVSKSDSVSTTITAKVYDRNTEITNSLAASKFNWIRSSPNPDSDASWNNSHKGMKQITIKHSDIIENSHFSCQVEVE